MPSMLMNLFRNCFPRLVVNEYVEAIRKFDEMYTDEFNFVIPPKDFARFEENKPEEGSFLTVSQYMFLYKYVTSAGNCEAPAPDYERVYYFFRDHSSMFLLKGWVPTKCSDEKGRIPERKLLANLNKKINFLKANGAEQVYVKETNTNATLSKHFENITNVPDQSRVEADLKNESEMGPVMVYPGPPPVKSTYNWGVINTWSRHIAPESHDNAPVDIFNHSRQIAFQSDSNINSLELLDRDIADVIEGKSVTTEHVSRRPNGSCGMAVSTLDTRDRRMRPRAAKGPRKPPAMCDKWRL